MLNKYTQYISCVMAHATSYVQMRMWRDEPTDAGSTRAPASVGSSRNIRI